MSDAGIFLDIVLWLVVDEEFPSAWVLVLEWTPSKDWYGFGPTGSGQIDTDMFAWIKQYWLGTDLREYLM